MTHKKITTGNFSELYALTILFVYGYMYTITDMYTVHDYVYVFTSKPLQD